MREDRPRSTRGEGRRRRFKRKNAARGERDMNCVGYLFEGGKKTPNIVPRTHALDRLFSVTHLNTILSRVYSSHTHNRATENIATCEENVKVKNPVTIVTWAIAAKELLAQWNRKKNDAIKLSFLR